MGKMFEKLRDLRKTKRPTRKSLKMELESYCVLTEIIRDENRELQISLTKMSTEAQNASYERDVYWHRYLFAKELLRANCVKNPAENDLKSLYEALAKKVDQHGLYKLKAAEKLLGPFNEAMFFYEAGQFEDETFGAHQQYKALLVQYADKLGQPPRDRWEIVQCAGGYEKCTDWTIDETTPEFIAFEQRLYYTIFENLGCKEFLPRVK